MTEEQVVLNGWEPKLCKIGTLYFKDAYFCKLNEDSSSISLFHCHDDMNPLGEASTFEEVRELQKQCELKEIKITEIILNAMKKRYNEIYSEDI